MRRKLPAHHETARIKPGASKVLTDEWARSAASVSGEVSVHLQGLDGPVAGRGAAATHYAASTIKLAVLISALAESASGRLDLDRAVRVTNAFPSVTGSLFTMKQGDDQDDATWRHLGGFVPLQTLLERSITESSNIATNVVVERIGIDTVNRTLRASRANGLSFEHFIGDGQAKTVGLINRVSARGLTHLMRRLARGVLLPSQETSWALELMATQRHRDFLPAGLPADAWAANKPGWTDTVNHDVALVRQRRAPEYVLAICTTTNDEHAASRAIKEISAATWEHWAAWHLS